MAADLDAGRAGAHPVGVVTMVVESDGTPRSIARRTSRRQAAR
jgi:hypothetical protein